MRVLIPYSGSGTNSTYSMYRLLSETDHEVVSLHLNMYYSSDEYSAWEREHFYKGVKWFKDNIRDFKAVEGVCSQIYPVDIKPLRKGFTCTFDNSIQNNRRETYVKYAKEFDIDLLVSGRGAEDATDTSAENVMTKDIKDNEVSHTVLTNNIVGASNLEASGYDFIIPAWSLTKRLTLDNAAQLSEEITAKWSQREKLPQELRNIITNCRCKGKQINCYWCNDLLINEVRPETGRKLDDIVLKALEVSRFSHLANPKTWDNHINRNDRYKKVLGFDFSEGSDFSIFEKLEEEMRDRARDMYARAGNI